MAELSREQARIIEWDCARVLIGFFNAYDQWRYQDMVDMMAPDGAWHRLGKALRGAEMLEVLNARPRQQTVRHVVTNMQITPTGADRAESLLYLTAYIANSVGTPSAPPAITSPALLLDAPGELVRVGDAWRIASLTMTRVFVFGA